MKEDTSALPVPIVCDHMRSAAGGFNPMDFTSQFEQFCQSWLRLFRKCQKGMLLKLAASLERQKHHFSQL